MKCSWFWILLGGACGMALLNEFDSAVVMLTGDGIVGEME